ncbi:MAG: hypothetical protein KIT48_04765 [Pseudolabrys sp.]|nr:hypothetical protein [Pseudolabrys sp.]
MLAAVLLAATVSVTALAQPAATLHEAIRKHDVGRVTDLLRAGAAADPAHNEDGTSPLEAACETAAEIGLSPGRTEMQRLDALAEVEAIVTLLLEHKADPDADVARKTHSANGGQTPLHAGLLFDQCVRNLLEAGANPNLRMTTDRWGAGRSPTVLQYGIGEIETLDQVIGLRKLIAAGADLRAAHHEHKSLKRLLVESLEMQLQHFVCRKAVGLRGPSESGDWAAFRIEAYDVLHMTGLADPQADRDMVVAIGRILDRLPALRDRITAPRR